MNQQFNYHPSYPYSPQYKRPRGYGLSNLVGDIALTVMTGGVWAIWWIIREVTR